MRTSADEAVGVADGLSPTELAALYTLEKRLYEVRIVLNSTVENWSRKEVENTVLAKELLKSDIPVKLLESLGVVTFETRKEIVHVFNHFLNLENPSFDTPIDLIPLKSKKLTIRAALSNSFGFGGTNASLIFTGPPE